MKLIDKAAVVAEIERLEERYASCPTRNNYENGLKEGRLIGYKDVLNKIRTLEVKEVDLEKELKNRIGNVGECDRRLAEHFFELGLKAQKGE